MSHTKPPFGIVLPTKKMYHILVAMPVPGSSFDNIHTRTKMKGNRSQVFISLSVQYMYVNCKEATVHISVVLPGMLKVKTKAISNQETIVQYLTYFTCEILD